jgi:hypothetical protein
VLDDCGGGSYTWTMHKTGDKRFGYLASGTMKTIQQVQKKSAKKDDDFIFAGLTGKQIK